MRQRLASGLELRIPHRPGVNHLRPDFERDVDVGEARRAGKADGVIEQRFR